MATDSTLRTWMYSGMVPPEKNHGAVDIGYWVGYRIAGAYYTPARERLRALTEVTTLESPLVHELTKSGGADIGESG